MIKSPIPEVSNKKQYRAIGIVSGMYKPHQKNLLNKLFDCFLFKVKTINILYFFANLILHK